MNSKQSDAANTTHDVSTLTEIKLASVAILNITELINKNVLHQKD